MANVWLAASCMRHATTASAVARLDARARERLASRRCQARARRVRCTPRSRPWASPRCSTRARSFAERRSSSGTSTSTGTRGWPRWGGPSPRAPGHSGAGPRLRPAAARGPERPGPLSAHLGLAASALEHRLHRFRARPPLRGALRGGAARCALRCGPRRLLGRGAGVRAVGSRAVRAQPVEPLPGNGMDALGASRVHRRLAKPVDTHRAARSRVLWRCRFWPVPPTSAR